MLRVEDLVVKYGELQVVHGVSFEVKKGEIFAIVGSNGAGKSTILKAIAGLVPPAGGLVTFDGRKLHEMPAHKIAACGVIYVPEGRRLFGRLSVMDNLLVGSYGARARAHRQENLETVFSLFPVLRERKHQKARTLSGGEGQMLAIARGIMSCPEVLMLDEPSLGIAPVLVDKIFEAIPRLREQGMAVVLVEQNVHRALEIADRGVVLQTGRIVLEGTADTLLGSELVKKAYLAM